MKVIKYILPLLCLGVIITACNSDDEESIAATEVQNLTTQSAPGSITLTWEYAVEEDANTTRLVEIRYYDPAVKKNVKKTISRFSNSFTIDNALKRYGEYEFEVQPFSTTFTPGVIQRITGVAERAPVIDEKTSTELAITIDNLTLGGFKPVGVTTIPQSSCIGDGNGPERLLDNNASTFLNTAYSGVPAGTTYYLDIVYPKSQKYLKFSYINRSAGSFPAAIECSVKVNENDEWTQVKTLTTVSDGLPEAASAAYSSEVYEAPFEFNYLRFHVKKTHTGNVNFSMAEFRIYNVERYFYDPEATEE